MNAGAVLPSAIAAHRPRPCASTAGSPGWVGVSTAAGIVYVLVDRRTTFDAIPGAVTDHDRNGEKSPLRVLTKSVEQPGCTVVFQHWPNSVSAQAAA